jgi:hypothetical protein
VNFDRAAARGHQAGDAERGERAAAHALSMAALKVCVR